MVTGADIEMTVVVAGNVYRDLDGSLVHLLNVERDLCQWTAIAEGPTMVQVTHIENFRRRFRGLDPASLGQMQRSA